MVTTPPEQAVPKNHAASFWSSKKRTNTIALFLMALSTLGSSWSGFQAALWGGIQTFQLAEATKMGRLSAESRLTANEDRNLDAALFMEYSRSMTENNGKLSDFLKARMRSEFQPAMAAWLATQPLANPSAPTSPFVMQDYHLKADQDARDQEASATAKYNEAQRASLNSGTYAMLTVLFAVALFLAGLINGFDEARERWICIFLSVAMILFVTIILVTLPVAHRG